MEIHSITSRGVVWVMRLVSEEARHIPVPCPLGGHSGDFGGSLRVQMRSEGKEQ